jgi:hypothetical protein
MDYTLDINRLAYLLHFKYKLINPINNIHFDNSSSKCYPIRGEFHPCTANQVAWNITFPIFFCHDKVNLGWL